MTTAGPTRHLTAAPEPVVVPRAHADRATYQEWVEQHCTSYASRWDRMKNYDRFVERWPVLQDWFDAPLRQRLLDKENCVRGQHPHGGASVIMPYLTYLSLVRGVGLDYPVLLARTFTSPFKLQARHGGLGVDAGLFDRHVTRLTELGYATARTQLVWPLSRMLLHRGDPNLTALGVDDLDELRAAIDAFSARLRLDPVREFYSRAPAERPPTETADGYLRSAIARLHAVHVLLFDLGQVDRPPTGRVTAGSWMDRLAPPGAPPKIRAVLEPYLRLHLDANLDRPQTVRHARDALRRLVTWMGKEHPEMASLADLHREHAEEFLRWLGTQTNQHTGAPLSISYRRTVVTLITRFVTETAAWGWDDGPARVLFTRGDIPKIPKPLPRFIPDHELATLMTAVEQLPNRFQRAALIVARWSGARRDEIRRLAVDCLDTYPDGHPRLRIPVGKGYAERMIPLHPQAADELQPLIDLARQQGGRRRYDPSAGREVQHIFVVRGKLLSKSLLFDMALAEACTAAGLVDSAGKATITAHRFRHTVGTQLAEGGARIQTIMAVLGHATPNMSIIYSTLSDPTVKQQYQDALDRHLGPEVNLAGPAADALREHRLDPEAVSWLQTNFLKTELELGHCLRTPAEGPCECDLVLTCSKFLTTSDYAPRLRARLEVEQQLIDDATARGWPREIQRHEATKTTPGATPPGPCLTLHCLRRLAAIAQTCRIEGALGIRSCHPSGMRSDGSVLPDPAETVVLHRLGLVRSDDLPDLAARWLAVDLVDTESVRMLAGHDPNDAWMLEKLLADSVSEADIVVRSSPADVQDIAVDWVTSTWRDSEDTRWAVSTLARLGETDPELGLGLFIGLDDEWNGGCGRLEPDLKVAAKNELAHLLHGTPRTGEA